MLYFYKRIYARGLAKFSEIVAMFRSGLHRRSISGLAAALLVSILVVRPSASPAAVANGEGGLMAQAIGPVESGARQAGTAEPSPEGLGFTGCGGGSAPLIDGDFEQKVVELVNAARAAQTPPLPPLKRVTTLDEAARYHAADLGQDDYFAHDTYDRVDGSLVSVCAWYDRVASYYDGAYKGENIAGGFATPQDVVSAWMSSPAHRANILSSDYWEIGVGYYQGGGTYVRYWVQDFGQRSDAYPLVVNGEAAQTDSRDVQLYAYGSWQEMRLRNEDGPWSAWQPFQPTSAWTLAGGVGYHTVSVEVRADATTAASTDSIYVSTSASVLANMPDSLSFIYSIPDRRLVPPFARVVPLNVGDNAVLSWNVSSSGTWYTVSPSQGATPNPFQITPIPAQMDSPTTYTGQVIVTAVGGVGVAGSPRPIDLTLRVIDTPLRSVFLPTVLRLQGEGP